MIIQTEMENTIPISNISDWSMTENKPNATMLFSSERTPTICEIAPLRFIIRKTEISNDESESDRSSRFSGIIVTRGVNKPELAMAVNAATIIKVTGTFA